MGVGKNGGREYVGVGIGEGNGWGIGVGLGECEGGLLSEKQTRRLEMVGDCIGHTHSDPHELL